MLLFLIFCGVLLLRLWTQFLAFKIIQHILSFTLLLLLAHFPNLVNHGGLGHFHGGDYLFAWWGLDEVIIVVIGGGNSWLWLLLELEDWGHQQVLLANVDLIVGSATPLVRVRVKLWFLEYLNNIYWLLEKNYLVPECCGFEILVLIQFQSGSLLVTPLLRLVYLFSWALSSCNSFHFNRYFNI